jgi:antitoxin (DNA-binding transcriptional repressor) of toxin-antitoxin stability system
MKTATVADLRNNFRRVSALIDNGESVDITKRGRVVARLVPPGSAKKRLVKIDWMAQLKEVWGDRVFSAAEVKAMRDAELEGEEG